MIREVIKKAMKVRKVKAKDLAEHIGINKSTMSLFLNNKINMAQEKIEMIFRFLNIELVIKKTDIHTDIS